MISIYLIFRVGQGFWVYGIQGLFKSGMRYISAEIWVFGISRFLNFRYKVYLPFLSLWLHIPKRMNLDRFMLFKNKVQLKVLIRVKKTMKGDNGDMYMTLLIAWLWWPLNSCFVDTYGDSEPGEPGMTSVTSGKSTWHADRSWQWPLERFFCRFPVFCTGSVNQNQPKSGQLTWK